MVGNCSAPCRLATLRSPTQPWATLPGVGRDIVVVASLYETTFYNYSYRLGFPQSGHWNEVFNSDIYWKWFNPGPQGNPGGIDASDPGMGNLPASASITLPANSLLIFAREWGDV